MAAWQRFAQNQKIKCINWVYDLLKDAAGVNVREFVQSSSKALPQGSKILDAGAGQCVYKKHFQHCNYFAVDFAGGDANWDYSHLDLVASLDHLPIESNSFDAVLCTEVLEHLEKPLAALKELYRVLRPKGVLFLTVPFYHHEHQVPYDFYRYTSYGLMSLLKEAGFEKSQIHIQPIGGIFMRWSYELTALFELFPNIRLGRSIKGFRDIKWLPFRVLFLIGLRFFQTVLLLLDPLDRSAKAPLGWRLVVSK